MTGNTNRPNILLFLPDQHRYDWWGVNEDLPLRTPNLDRLAARGMTFTNALCPSPLCAPSRAALAAGKEYPSCRVANNGEDYPLDQPTFYQMLRDAGYAVTGVGKFDLQKATADHSLDGKALLDEWGFSDGVDSKGKWDAVASWDGEPHDAYLGYLHTLGLAQVHIDDMLKRRGRSFAATTPTPLPEHAYGDNWIADAGLRVLDRIPVEQPWFMQVNLTGPHDPVDVTEAMQAPWLGVGFPTAHGNDEFDHATHTAIRQNYAAMVENIDRHLGRYVDALDERGELANTIIVYASDHGEMLGDHNRWGKATYYQPSVGIPLVMAGPGVSPGRTFDGVVGLHDLAATFLEAASLQVPDDMDSRSLIRVLSGQADHHRDYLLSGLIMPSRATWHLIFDGRHKLVCDRDSPPILFDLQEDPWEDDNVAGDHPDVVVRLKAWMDVELGLVD